MKENQNQNQDISLKDIIFKGKKWVQYLLQNYKKIIICGFLGALFGLGYSYIKKPVYIATLSFCLEDDKGGGGLSLASQFGLDLGGKAGGLFNGENLLVLFKSRNMIEKTLLTPVVYKGKKMSLMEMYSIINKNRKSWQKSPKFKNIQFIVNADRKFYTRVQDSIIGIIAQGISASNLIVKQKEKKSSIVDIEFKSNNELFAKVFTVNLINVVSNFYIETKSKKAKINLDILQRQTDSMRRVLNGNIIGVAVDNDNTFALNPAMNVKRVPSAKKNVDLQANSSILSELIRQCEMAKVTLRKETPLIQLIDSPILPLQKERLGKIKGIILGGIIGGFLIVLWLLLTKIFKDLINK